MNMLQLTIFETAVYEDRMDVAEMLVWYGCFGAEDRKEERRQLTETLATDVWLSDGKLAQVNASLSRHPLPSQDTLDEALRVTAAQGYTSIALELLNLGARPATKDMNGRTALHYASSAMHEELAELLIRRGAESAIAIEDIAGSTPIDLAIGRGIKASHFIGNHVESHFHRLMQLVEPEISASISPSEARAALIGVWKGRGYFSQGLIHSIKAKFSQTGTPNYDESAGSFYPVHSFVGPTSVVWFIYLGSSGGLQCRGHLDANLRTMTGTCGRNCKQLVATFILEKMAEGEEEETDSDASTRVNPPESDAESDFSFRDTTILPDEWSDNPDERLDNPEEWSDA